MRSADEDSKIGLKSGQLVDANITLVIWALAPGGAERVMVTLAAGLAERYRRVNLVTLRGDVEDFYDTPEGVQRIMASKVASASCRWFDLHCQRRRLSAVRDTIIATSPDVVVSILDTTNITVLQALRTCDVPIIVNEQVHPPAHDIGWRWRLLRRVMYPSAHAVIVPTEHTARWAEDRYPRWRTVVIPNPVAVPAPASSVRSTEELLEGKSLVAMGRLAPEKGFDLLLRAFSRCAPALPEWRLTILGEGPERSRLEDLVHDLELTNRVRLPGLINPPWPVLRSSELFVMSSRYEGFGLALVEAMACGLAVISFDCPAGPPEIVRHGIDGVLVPSDDVDELASAIRTLAEDDALRNRLSDRAPEVLDRFSEEKFLNRWDRVIQSGLEA